VTVVVLPLPKVVTVPGFRINVHAPLEGNPLRATLPVATVHVGWEVSPSTGAVGTPG